MVQQSTAQGTQGTQAPVPPIPKMEAGTPGTLTRAQIHDATQAKVKAIVAKAVGGQARQAAQLAAQQAAQQAGAPGTLTNPNPPVPDAPKTTTSTGPPGDFPFGDVPPNAYILSLSFFVTAAACVIGYPIVRAIARRMDRRTQALHSAGPDVTPQLRALQDSVDAMAIELERISEAQRFTSKLLSERAGAREGEQAR